MNNNQKIYDTIILGMGPAGLTAALYLARAGLKIIVLGKKENSRLYSAHMVTNYFGLPEGIDGRFLLEKGLAQAKDAGAELKEEESVDIRKQENNFLISTSNNNYLGKSILFATGVKNISSLIKSEDKFVGRGIAFCVACDGLYFKDKKVVVIGEGDFAAREALELLEYTKDVNIYSDGKDFSISEDIKKQLEVKNINLYKDKIKEFIGDSKLESLMKNDGEEVDIDGVFIAKGMPKSSDLAYKLGLDTFNNYIQSTNNGETNIKGVFVAGDATGIGLQIGTAVGSAINASFSVVSYLKNGEFKQ
ncbi:NAD(P)/FAD-dependent oxidoreductase [bacterium CG_4_10_14_0_2_um_filter_33_32]|nr:MAG: NAD(P)/FAD-dependent oxidoreductase [bacterium CG10_big_fil_rev_8_21_14_0_10_33_18]PIU76829.1 MAG: NAD(P)/FAD-dependent oxidoreductase [bacterium CG06_land_8_20_14_3_00_33_50]PIW81628.1 MAG: NAD(P)/FAD-dependent oxidoreductase [bacterium CG_4_8_14_3_um_filter_33_28]PIY85514.1 MAG: NAD(P)/FAD-dependent oxidoreductase [bacterium CG_4_10_14_0_8_um_filter_33_57]PIZ85493.1 MAG: NAD(P)/FAD-dependent oxidoreductase [bacterium CG_4_10_14_0_2_um_filter_33_32]PJA72378.1 MAG: NAD(P)/FAD-dependent